MFERRKPSPLSSGSVWRHKFVSNERALYPAITEYFRAREYLTKPFSSYGDILAYGRNTGRLASVEAKPADARDAIGQALSYLDFADAVYVAIPETGDPRRDLLSKLGLGLLIVKGDGTVVEALQPKVNAPTALDVRSRLIALIERPSAKPRRAPQPGTGESAQMSRIASASRVLSNDTRLHILNLLDKKADGRLSFMDLRAAVAAPDGRVWYHLVFLGMNGLISAEQTAVETTYCITERGRALLKSAKTMSSAPNSQRREDVGQPPPALKQSTLEESQAPTTADPHS